MHADMGALDRFKYDADLLSPKLWMTAQTGASAAKCGAHSVHRPESSENLHCLAHATK